MNHWASYEIGEIHRTRFVSSGHILFFFLSGGIFILYESRADEMCTFYRDF